MMKLLASALAMLMALTVGAGTVTATGNSSASLGDCTDAAEDYFGGIKVYARDSGKGASRVMCPPSEEVVVCEPPACSPALTASEGFRFDRNLKRRNKARPPLEDIWNGFHKNIESFKLRAAAGCETIGALTGPGLAGPGGGLFFRRLDNSNGVVARTRLFEVPRTKDNRATGVIVFVTCGGTAFPIYATGDIRCNGAEDKEELVGWAHLRSRAGGIEWAVVLSGAAPNWDYYVEFNQKTSECQRVRGTFEGFTTDETGSGVFRGVLSLRRGFYTLNVNVVSNPANNVPPNPRHREMSGFDYVGIRVR